MDADPLRTPRRLELALMFTHTCNIACRHCGILSSPQNKAKMRLEDARRYIQEAAGIPGLKTVTFTGGEPFLFQDEHAELIALCSSLGFGTRMVTNGFWGRTMKQGRRVLGRMRDAGLRELNFSADKFHLEFQDASILRNALECARELGFARIVSYITNGDNPPLEEFSSTYGLPMETLADLRLMRKELRVLEEFKDEKIFVYYGGLIGLGRAAEHPADLRYVPLDLIEGGEGCPEVVNKPVIYPDGDFQACCCAGGKIATFTVGNLRDHTVPEIFEKMFERSQYQFINCYGPKDLYEIVTRARPDLPRKDQYTSICEVCVVGTAGVSAEEVDRIVDAEIAARTLAALGIDLQQDAAALAAPARRALHVVQ